MQAVLAYIDIDNFKTINDIYGHEGGDFVLKILLIFCWMNQEGTDYIFRLGGERVFVLLV